MKLQIFTIKNVPKLDFNYTYLAVNGRDSAIKKDENYYLQVFLKDCKYIEKKVVKHIHDHLSNFSSDDE